MDRELGHRLVLVVMETTRLLLNEGSLGYAQSRHREHCHGCDHGRDGDREYHWLQILFEAFRHL